MKDVDIRKSLVKKLIQQNEGHDYKIIHEMTVCDGMSRVDVAVANGNLYGYEIKSDVDSLERLPSQVYYYNQTFDKVFIVVGEKYKNCIDEYIPDWWGIYTATYDKNSNIILKEKKKGKKNKSVRAESLLELLWKEEIIELLKQHGIKALSGKNRRILRKIAAERISIAEIRNFTRETLKNRREWRE